MSQPAGHANPYPGLRPFKRRDSHLFFGRESQSDELLHQLRSYRFLAVIGPSGSGKSSLVRAGLLPGIYRGFMRADGSTWRHVTLRPGSDPIGNLATALSGIAEEKGASGEVLSPLLMLEAILRRGALGLVEAVEWLGLESDERLLVVVDQFEEIFRFRQALDRDADRDDSAAFVKLLLEAARPEAGSIYVLLTMRSDYLGDCAQFRDLPEAINDGQYLIPRMTRAQLRQAVVGPAAVGGATVSARLVQRLLDDAGDEPDQLPLLQHALRRVWELWTAGGRRGEPLDVEQYRAVGTITRALSQDAEEAYRELEGGHQREIAEKLFRRLTEKGPDGRERRRPTKLREIVAVTGAGEGEVVEVIDRFRRQGRSFLMPPYDSELESRSLVDISHESLMRGWSRLRGWVESEAESAQRYRHLAQRAEDYWSGNGTLLSGPDLGTALDWLRRAQPNRSWAARYDREPRPAAGPHDRRFEATTAFIDKSRRRRWWKWGGGGLLVLAVWSLVILLASLNKIQRLRGEAEDAETRFEQANDQLVKAKAEHERTSRKIESAVAARGRLEQELAEARRILKGRQGDIDRLSTEENELSETVRDLKFASKGLEDQVGRLEREKRDLEHEKQGLDQDKQDLEREKGDLKQEKQDLEQEKQDLEKDATELREKILARRLAAEAASLFEREPDRVDLVLLLGVESLRQHLTAEGNDVLRRALATQKRIGTRLEHRRDLRDVAFSPDGLKLATSSKKVVHLWHLETTEAGLLRPRDRAASRTLYQRCELTAFSFSPDGKRLATACRGVLTRLYDLEGDRDPLELREDRPSLKDLARWGDPDRLLAFSPDGNYLASGRAPSRVRLWEVATGARREYFPDKRLRWLGFTPDGSYLANAGGHTVELRRVPDFVRTRSFSHKDVRRFSFSPDGKHLVTAGDGRDAILWDVASGEELRRLEHGSKVESLAFSASGDYVAIAGNDEVARVWKIGAGDGDGESEAEGEQPVIVAHDSEINQLAFSPRGPYLATASDDNSARVWATDDGREVARLAHDDNVKSLAFGPNGRWLATLSDDQTVQLSLWRPEDLKAATCAYLRRDDLTEAEWDQYIRKHLPEEPYRKTCDSRVQRAAS